MTRTPWGMISLAMGIFLCASAQAGINDVISGLVGTKAPGAEFVGTWTAGPGDIDHIVVSAPASGPLRIQVFGRCDGHICNWGALPARVRTNAPNSATVQALTADFNLGYALRHITLHRMPTAALRLDVVTEFTDGSDRHDYEIAGQLLPAGTAVTSAPPSAAAAVRAVPAVAPYNDTGLPLAAATSQLSGDCFGLDTDHVYLAPANGNWILRDNTNAVQNFGPFRNVAYSGLSVITFYRVDEVCQIGHSATKMVYFRAAGEVPRQPMADQDCAAVQTDKVAAVKRADHWIVAEDGRELYDYGTDSEGANQAVTQIKSLNLSRQCFYNRERLAASYWLSH